VEHQLGGALQQLLGQLLEQLEPRQRPELPPQLFEWLVQMDRAMTEMRGFMERVAQVVARQEHDLGNGLPRVLGVVEGRLARQEGTTQHLTEATGSLRTRLDEQAQRIVELVHESQNLRQGLADSIANWGQQLATHGVELQAVRNLDGRVNALAQELTALRVAVQNGQSAVAPAAASLSPDERAFIAGQAADVAALQRQMPALATRVEVSQIYDRLGEWTTDAQQLRQELRQNLRQTVQDEVRSVLDQMGASRSEFEERMRSELGFVHGELRNIRAALEDDESDEQPAAESVVSSEGERGDLDDPLPQGYGK
jgi:hypothetical protein